MAQAIRTALEMPLAERQERHAQMFAKLAANDIDRWADRFLLALAETRQRPGILDSLRQLFTPPAS
jgi:trehalose 6-phosphate synthase